jgi:hypothetical protein
MKKDKVILPPLRVDRPGEGLFVQRDVVIEPYPEIQTIFTRPLEMDWSGTIEALDNLSSETVSIPTRPAKVEVCEHCGAEFQGLFHCQSLKDISEEPSDTEFLRGLEDFHRLLEDNEE